jgi:hypothetical protein
MMVIHEHLRKLARMGKDEYLKIIPYDDTMRWPEGRRDELVKMNVLVETQPNTAIRCNKCAEECDIDPIMRKRPDGRTVWVAGCPEDGSLVFFDTERFQQWQINIDRLAELGYEWTPLADKEMSTEDVGGLMGISRSSVSNLVNSGLLQDNGLAGQKRKVMESSVIQYMFTKGDMVANEDTQKSKY